MSAGLSAVTRRADSRRRTRCTRTSHGGTFIDCGAQLSSRRTTKHPFRFGAFDRYTKLVGVSPCVQAVLDGARNRRDGDGIYQSDVGCTEVATVEAVQLTASCAWMVIARDCEVDARRVHVSETMQRQGRFVRNGATPQRPRHSSCEIIMIAPWQNGHPVHTTTGTLETTARLQQPELPGIHTNIPGITSRHIAMLLGRKLHKPIPDSHVRNRIK